MRTFTYDARNNPLNEDFAGGSLLGSRRILNDYDYTVGYGEPVGDPPMQPVFQFMGLTQIGVGTSGTPYQDYRVEYVLDNETGRI